MARTNIIDIGLPYLDICTFTRVALFILKDFFG
jgi:hypothetical protein